MGASSGDTLWHSASKRTSSMFHDASVAGARKSGFGIKKLELQSVIARASFCVLCSTATLAFNLSSVLSSWGMPEQSLRQVASMVTVTSSKEGPEQTDVCVGLDRALASSILGNQCPEGIHNQER
eukprot:293719-Amphidinium_carterae.1